MLFPIAATNGGAVLDWGAIGVIGGAIYSTYQVLTNNQIKNAILQLELAIQDRFAKVEREVAVNYEKFANVQQDVSQLQRDLIQVQKDIAFRDGLQAMPTAVIRPSAG